MARCIDFPCCGHEAGCCPDFDSAGRQLNMRCTCGAVLPIDNRYSICEDCMNEGNEDYEPEFNEDMDGDFDSGMASAGFGTDEDYNHYEHDIDFGYEG